MTVTRSDTDSLLATTGLPLTASNLLVTVTALSATITTAGQCVVVFNITASDSGGLIGAYTGDAAMRNCTDNWTDLTIGVAAVQVGDGSITYDYTGTVNVGDSLEWTAGGVPIACSNPVQSHFLFNGNDTALGAATALVLNSANEGAITFTFNVLNTTGVKDVLGSDATGVRRRNATVAVRASLFTTNTITNDLTPSANTDHDIELLWPVGQAAGSISLDGVVSVSPVPNGGGSATTPFYLGRGGSDTNIFNALLWDVRIYSDEAMTTLTNHWPMNEGSGLVFNDIVGGDNITFDASLGAWT